MLRIIKYGGGMKLNFALKAHATVHVRDFGITKIKLLIMAVLSTAIALPFASFNIASAGTTEFTIPSSNSKPLDITRGPDGAMWYAESDAFKIGRISTTGNITEYSTASAGRPQYLTTGSDDNIWFTTDNFTIGKITTSGALTTYAVPHVSAIPPNNQNNNPRLRIITGPDGNLWFANGYFIGTITTSGVITQYPVYYNVTSVASGPDGNIWFVTSGNYTGKMTTSGVVTASNISGMQGTDIVTGPDGNLWITNSFNSIVRLTTSGTSTTYSLPTPNSYPQSITVGPDGALWFTEIGTSKVGRITTAGSITEYSTNTATAAPFGIATGPDGNIWYTERDANKVARLSFR